MRILESLFAPKSGAASAQRERQHRAEANRRLGMLLATRRLRAWQFRRRHPLGPHVVDFVCLERALVIELTDAAALQLQRSRHDFLVRLGFDVLCFGPAEVIERASHVRRTICERLRA